MKKIIVLLVVLIGIAIVVVLQNDLKVKEEMEKKERILMEIERKKIEIIKKRKREAFIKSIGVQIFDIFEKEAKRRRFVFDDEICFFIKNREELENDVANTEKGKTVFICSPLVEIESDHIQVSIGKQRFYAIENDEVVLIGKVSTGAVAGSTPKGIHRIQNQAAYTISRKYKCPLIHWMAVTKDAMIGLHALSGTAYEARLGSPASHGCIRLSHTNAKRLFDWVTRIKEENTQFPQVYIY